VIYELYFKKITADDIDYIISKVADDEEILNAFSFFKKEPIFSNSWVVDKENDEFFVKFPRAVMPESLGVPYLIFFNGAGVLIISVFAMLSSILEG